MVRQITILIIIIVISIYMLLDAKRIGRFVAGHFPTRSVSDGEEYVRRAKAAVVGYVKAQVLLSAILGASVGLAMWLLSMIGAFPSGARYALFFGVWAGVMEAIPYLGPVLAAVPPTVVAVFDSPLAALWVIITFVLIQEIEGHILVPVIMGSRFRVHPLVVIFADPRRRRDPRHHRHAHRHPADPAGQGDARLPAAATAVRALVRPPAAPIDAVTRDDRPAGDSPERARLAHGSALALARAARARAASNARRTSCSCRASVTSDGFDTRFARNLYAC